MMTMIPPEFTPNIRLDVYRSEPYRRHVARQPCEACAYAHVNDQGYICQAAHIRMGFFGMAKKPSDRRLISLCPRCHQKFDTGQERFIREVWDMTVQERIDLSEENWSVWAVGGTVVRREP